MWHKGKKSVVKKGKRACRVYYTLMRSGFPLDNAGAASFCVITGPSKSTLFDDLH